MAFRLPKPEIALFFDGSTSGGNPGEGGAAAVFEIDGKVGDASTVAPVSNRMGFVGNNCAEYYGLILGLRELLHAYPAMEYALTIKGDSELVIKQLKGEYQVRDEVLKNYYLVARGLLARISKAGSSIKFIHVPRAQNQGADALANEAAVLKISPNLRFFHYPCIGSLLDGTIQGTKCSLSVKVAHDIGAASFTPETYIDAAVFRQCYGDDALETIQSTGKKNLIEGKSDMTVLGFTTLQFTFGHGYITVYNAFVVDFLPWPLQISMDHPACSWDNVFGGRQGAGYSSNLNWKSQVPQRFQSHPYWTSNVLVLGDG